MSEKKVFHRVAGSYAEHKGICQEIVKQNSKELKITASENSSENPKSSYVSKRILIYDYESNKGLFEYLPQTEAFAEVKDEALLNAFSSRPRGSTVCSLDRYIYFFGAEDKWGNRFNKCYKWNLLENKLIEILPMTDSFICSGTVKLHNCIYVFGLREREAKFCIERYNLTTQAWEPISVPRFEHFLAVSSLLAVDERLCLIGLTHLLWYDPQTGKWSKGDPVPRNFQFNLLVFAIYANGKIFVIFTNKFYCFDLLSKSWNEYQGPNHAIGTIISMSHIQTLDSTDLLIMAQCQFFIFRPPNYWKCIPRVPNFMLSPVMTSIGE